MLLAFGINRFSHDVAHSITGVKAEIEECSVTIGRSLINHSTSSTMFHSITGIKAEIDECSVTMGRYLINHSTSPFFYRYKGRDWRVFCYNGEDT